MKNKIPDRQKVFLLEECESLSSDGLRTLVITQKVLSEKEFQKWYKIYEEANQTLRDRE